MDTSDPLISSLRLNTRIHQRKRLALPPEVIALLSCEDLPDISAYEQNINNEDSSDDEPEDENEEDNLVLENEFTD